MAQYFSPRVVTTGLAQYLDAGNVKSYPRSGTSWYDLTGAARNGTLSTPTFNPSGYFDAGSCTFPAGTYNAGSPQQGTFRLVFKMAPIDTSVSTFLFADGGSSTNLVYFYRNYFWSASSSNFAWLLYYTKTDTTTDSILLYNTYTAGTWYDLTMTFNATGTMKAYINGQLSNFSTPVSFSSWRRTGSSTPSINVNSTAGNGSLSLFQWYDRELTPGEVAQNFDAVKGRLGL